MPSFRRRESVSDTAQAERPPAESGSAQDPPGLAQDPVDNPDQALELAEAEAAAAEAAAAAARARAEALRLRKAAEERARTTRQGDDPQLTDQGTSGAAEAVDPAEPAVEAPAVEAPTAQEAPALESGERGGSGRWRLAAKIAAATVAVVVTLGLLGLSGYWFYQVRLFDQEQQRRAEFAAAGRQAVVNLMSLDFNKVEEDVKRIMDSSTGQFKTDFELQAEDFIKVAQESKVVTDVTVNSTAVQSMDDDSALVLVAATSRVTNAAGAKQEPRAWRLAVNLQREGDQIKMSKVEFVP